MSRTIVHTLGYNIPTLIDEATESLFNLNPERNFTHVIADLGYPLGQYRETWDIVPQFIPINKRKNAISIIDTATLHKSDCVRIPNRGVSGNWTQIAYLYDIGRGDVLIGADPDERPMDAGWVDAMAKVMQGDSSIAIVSLVLPEQLVLDSQLRQEEQPWVFREILLGRARDQRRQSVGGPLFTTMGIDRHIRKFYTSRRRYSTSRCSAYLWTY